MTDGTKALFAVVHPERVVRDGRGEAIINPAYVDWLEAQCAELRAALKEEMAWDMGGRVPERTVWRVGRKVRRTVYAQFGTSPSDDDPLIGVMDTPHLALSLVTSHNEALARDSWDEL